MTEAQERNLIRFVIANSFPLDDMYAEYTQFCREENHRIESKEHFARTVLGESFPIIIIEGKAFVFGAMRKGDTRQKAVPYAKDAPPVEPEEYAGWMKAHAWTPGS